MSGASPGRSGAVHILHVLSQHEVTGAETYAATLIAEQAREGHRVTIVSDTLNTAVDADYLPMDIGRRDYPQRVRNVFALRRLIRSRVVRATGLPGRGPGCSFPGLA